MHIFETAGGIFKELLPKPEAFSRGLYTFDIGQNDLTGGLLLNLSTQQVKASIPDILGQFKTVVKVRVCNVFFFKSQNGFKL